MSPCKEFDEIVEVFLDAVEMSTGVRPVRMELSGYVIRESIKGRGVHTRKPLDALKSRPDLSYDAFVGLADITGGSLDFVTQFGQNQDERHSRLWIELTEDVYAYQATFHPPPSSALP